jgi:hypothetical protein
MKTKKPSIYKLYDSYTSHEYYFLDKKKAKLFGEKVIWAESDISEEPEPFTNRYELYKISING